MPSSRARMGRLRPIPDVEFSEDVRDAVLDGAFGEVEPIGNVLVRCRVRDPDLNSCQVSLNSRLHRSASTDFSVTAHALTDPMRPTLVRRHPEDPRELGHRCRSHIHGELTGGPMSSISRTTTGGALDASLWGCTPCRC